MKKYILIAICGILTAGILFGGYWLFKNFNNLVADTSLYSKDDLDTAVENAYNEGRGNYNQLQARITELTLSADYLQVQLNEKQTELDNIATALLNSNLTIEQKQQLITELENDIYNLELYVVELDNQLTDTLNEVELLTDENSNLSLQITNMTAELNEAQNTISGFSAVVEQYEQVIDDLINGAAYNFLVTFIYNDIPTVVYGGYYDIEYEYPEFESTTHAVFNGWSLDGETLITATTFTVPAGTVLQDNKVTYIALVDRYIDIIFINGNTELSTATYPLGVTFNSVIKPNITNTDYVHFDGWSLDGKNVYVSNTTPLNYSQTFKAIFKYYQKVTFKQDTTVLHTAFFERNTNTVTSASVTPVTPEYNQFLGWAVSGSTNVVTFANYYLTTDTDFVPVYKDLRDGVYEVFYTASGNPVCGSAVVKGGKLTNLIVLNRVVVSVPQSLPYSIQNQQIGFGAAYVFNFYFQNVFSNMTVLNQSYNLGYVRTADILGNESTYSLYLRKVA